MGGPRLRYQADSMTASDPSREYVYGGSALLAKIDSSGTNYYHQDHLSNRVLTDSSGNSLGQRGHYPFGETWYESGTTTSSSSLPTSATPNPDWITLEPATTHPAWAASCPPTNHLCTRRRGILRAGTS